MRACTVDVFLLPALPGSHPPLGTVEEGRCCAVYTVNGQELRMDFIIVAVLLHLIRQHYRPEFLSKEIYDFFTTWLLWPIFLSVIVRK